MRSEILRPSARCRGSIAGIVVLVLLVALFFAGRHFVNQNRRTERRALVEAQQDPKIMLERFYVMRSQDYSLKEGKWERFFDFMSTDDRRWFQENTLILSSMSPRTEGMVALAASEGERRYAALEYLLDFHFGRERPIVSTIEIAEPHAVAFVHNPNDPQSLQEVFLIKENGGWRIRRFHGARDNHTVMSEIVSAKKWDEDKQLSVDEMEFDADPENYHANLRQRLLAEVGLEPEPKASPSPEATPTPPPPAYNPGAQYPPPTQYPQAQVPPRGQYPAPQYPAR